MDMAEPFMALVIYPSDPDGQARQAENLMRMAGDTVRTMPGFLGTRVFLSEDGAHLITLTEWADRESFQAFRQSELPRGIDYVVMPAKAEGLSFEVIRNELVSLATRVVKKLQARRSEQSR